MDWPHANKSSSGITGDLPSQYIAFQSYRLGKEFQTTEWSKMSKQSGLEVVDKRTQSISIISIVPSQLLALFQLVANAKYRNQVARIFRIRLQFRPQVPDMDIHRPFHSLKEYFLTLFH